MLKRIISEMKAQGWKVFENPWELNIVGLRAESTRPNHFDDLLTVFYRDEKGKWQFHSWKATTDPGLHYLHTPISLNLGTAILAMGQYRDAYRIDRHRGQYYALCQRNGPVTVIRDYDRDSELDFNNGVRMSGMFGINIHRSVAVGSANLVDRHSAGCQVFQNAEDFQEFMRLCEVHRKLHGNIFTYSLIDFRAMQRANRKRWAKRGAILTGLSLLFGGIIYSIKKSNHHA